MEVTNALTAAHGISLKLFYHLCGACGTANRRAGNNTCAATRYVPDDRIPLRAKPVLNSRIQDLIGNWVPAMREHQFARQFKVCSCGNNHL